MKLLKSKMVKTLAIAFIVCSMFSATVYAGMDLEGYEVTCGKFNGSGSTGTQITYGHYSTPYVNVTHIDDNKALDVQETCGSLSGGWQFVTTGYSGSIPAVWVTANAGCEVRLKFSNALAEPTRVQTRGNWKSN